VPQALIPLAAGFEEIEAVAVTDLLRRAGIEVTTASVTDQEQVIGAHGIEIRADTTLFNLKGRMFGAIVLPGGMPGTTNLAGSPLIRDLLKRHSEQGFLVAAICAAPSLLGEWGLLKGKKATCYPGFEAKLTGAILATDDVVEDENVITSRGPGTAIPFALKLIEKLVGPAKAKEVQSAVLAPLN
jgi:4-methyl-5(b-hydroxyethyl)-thiazole monophosphate biosynthesis